MLTFPITFFSSDAPPPSGGAEWSHPSLRDAVAGYYAGLDSTAQASDQFGGSNGVFQIGAVRDLKDNQPCYKLNGAGAGITTADISNLPTTAISISFWVNPTTLTLYDSFATTASNTNWLNGCGFYIYSGNELRFFVNNWGANFAIGNFSTTNDWVHICGTWDGTTIKIYVDGVLGGTTGTFSGPITNGILRIGNGNGAYTLDGYIDDILVYDRALSASEVTELASARGYVYQTNMSFGWNFPNTETNPPLAGYLASADTGADAEDQFGTADGTLVSGATRVTSDGLSAYSFNGTTSYIQLGEMPDINGVSQCSHCAWVYRGASGIIIPIFSNSGNLTAFSGNNARFWSGWWSDNILYFVISTVNSAYGQVTINKTGWHHVAFVFDGTRTGNSERCKIYLNGELQTLIFPSGAIPSVNYNNTLTDPTIGLVEGWEANANSYIDDVLVFDRVLTGGEIAMLASKRGIIYEPNNLPTNLTSPDHWYIASEDTGTDAEDLIATNDGLLQNGATRTIVDGLSAYSFDGNNDNINFSTNSWDISGLTEYSMCMWLRPDTLAVNKGIGGWSGSGNEFLLKISTSNSTSVRAISGTASQYGDTAAGTLNVSALTHIAIVYNGSYTSNTGRLKVYINGALQNLTYTGTIPAALPTLPSNNIRLAMIPSVGNYLHCKIDDVRFYDTALSADEIFYISRSRTQGFSS